MTLAFWGFSEFFEGYAVGVIVSLFAGPLIGRPIVRWFESSFPWRVRVERREGA